HRSRWQAARGVAAPIGKPVITGDHGPLLGAPGDPELFAREHQLPRQRMLARGIRQGVLPLPGCVPRHRDVPSPGDGIRAGEDDYVRLSVERHLDRPGCEQVLFVVETAIALGSMQDTPVPIGTAANDRRRPHIEVTANPGGVDDPTITALRHVKAALAVSMLVVVDVRKEWPEL